MLDYCCSSVKVKYGYTMAIEKIRKEVVVLPHIAVVGSLNMDLIMHTPRLPALGETILGGPFSKAEGGKGANQSVACARLGAQVAHIGRVGKDSFGEHLLGTLIAEGIETEGIRFTEGTPTGVATICIVEGDNSIIVAPGANSIVSEEDVKHSRRLMEGADAILFQLEVPVPAVMEGLKIAREMGIKTILNPAPWTPLPEETLPLVDVFVPNRIELTQASGTDDIEKGAMAVLEMGVGMVVVTLGSEGAAYFTKEASGTVPSIKVTAVDTTGAGDTFTAALAVALTEGKPVEESVHFACCAGALACRKLGAQPSLPYREELDLNL